MPLTKLRTVNQLAKNVQLIPSVIQTSEKSKMKIAQVVALMVGVSYTLTSASVSFVNMVTTSRPNYPVGLGGDNSQTTPIMYWVIGLLFFCLAGSLNRIHKPIATAIGMPGILLMITGGFGSFIFSMFQSQMVPIMLNLASAVLYLVAIFLIYKFDEKGNVAPIYQTNPLPVASPTGTAKPTPVATPFPQPVPRPVAPPNS